MTLPIQHHRSQYLEETDTLDWAKSHLTSLNRAEVRGRIPAKLSITIRPMVIDKDDPEFKSEWNKAIEAAEKSLLKTLQTHLSKVISKATDKIRQLAKQLITKIKTIRGQPAVR